VVQGVKGVSAGKEIRGSSQGAHGPTIGRRLSLPVTGITQWSPKREPFGRQRVHPVTARTC
jgi:hypothetical protein